MKGCERQGREAWEVCADGLKEASALIGSTLAVLHDGGLVHGDLTTSNMILRQNENEGGKRDLLLIDFGLSFNSALAEDKAVDLYVLERALLSLHSAHEGLVSAASWTVNGHRGTQPLLLPDVGCQMEAVLATYTRSSRYWSATLNKLAQGKPPSHLKGWEGGGGGGVGLLCSLDCGGKGTAAERRSDNI